MKLENKNIAILATDGFEESELFLPMKALQDAGAHVDIVSIKEGDIKAWKKNDWGKSIHVDSIVKNAKSTSFDALMIPGGVMNPDKLRNDKDAVAFVKSFMKDKKPIASICHGPQVLIEAGITKGKTLTSWASLKTDLTNSGAHWVDREVVVDGNLVTSRCPEDIPAFNEKMIEQFAATPNHK
ncbi:MAG: type 1 glutamine amidotransferase [Bdellovibrionales bacterium]|nr:type 1 glutamine amidotransferase [Bdellovibrionales bacterium]